MERFLWVCFGGAIGTGTRYLVAQWAAGRFGAVFPFGTLLVNLTGCFLLAALMDVAVAAWPPTFRTAITVGVMGGLTTYSSFNFETTRLLQDGAPGLAALNAAATVAGCFVAGWLGLLVSRQLLAQ
ncbi:MAG: CrcB family protein [Vicinamibacterales bacterium]